LKTKINKKEKDYNEYIKSLRGTIIDFPPKPLNCFSIFIKENLDWIKNDINYDPNLSIFKNVAPIWKKLDKKEIEKYKKKSEVEVKLLKEDCMNLNRVAIIQKNTKVKMKMIWMIKKDKRK